jgi:exonuclease SbcC
MRPLKLTMTAFGSYADEQIIDFTELGASGLYLITGETGSGKTTIFDAISFALYGWASGDARGNHDNYFHSDYAAPKTKTSVALTFLVGGDTYRVLRTLKPQFSRETKELKKYNQDAELILPDGTVFTRESEVNARIAKVIGLDRGQFAQIVMIAQNDFLRFLQSGTEERLKILRRIFGTEALKQFQEQLKGLVKKTSGQRELLLHDFQRYEVDVYKREEQFIAWEQQIEADKAGLTEADTKLKEYDSKKQTLAAAIAIAQGLVKNFNDLAASQAALEKHEALSDQMRALQVKSRRGEIALRKVKPIGDEAEKGKRDYEAAYEALTQGKRQTEAAAGEQESVKKILADLRPLEEAMSDFAGLTEAWKTAADQLSKLKTLETGQREIIDKQTTLTALQIQLDNTLKTLESLPPVPEGEATLAQLARELEGELGKQGKLTGLVQRYTDIADKCEMLSALQGELNTVLKTLAELPSIADREAALAQLTKEWEMANAKQNALTDLQRDYEEITNKQRELAKAQADFETFNRTYQEYNEKYQALEEAFLRNQAGIMAQGLEEGKPCPVCGSKIHPAPATLADREVTEATLKKAREARNKAQVKREDASSAAGALRVTAETLTSKFIQELAAHLPEATMESAGVLLRETIGQTAAAVSELSQKKGAGETLLNQLHESTQEATEKRDKLAPKCTILEGETKALIQQFISDYSEFDQAATWDTAGERLQYRLVALKELTNKLFVQKTEAEQNLEKLKTATGDSISKRDALTQSRTSLESEIATRTARFLSDYSTISELADWDTTIITLPKLLAQAKLTNDELSQKKKDEEAKLKILKEHWESANKRKGNADKALTAAETLIAERQKVEQASLTAWNDTQAKFIEALQANDFVDAADYFSALVTEEELANISNTLADYVKQGEQLARDITRLMNETTGKEKPDMEKLQTQSETVADEAEALAAKRDEVSGRLKETGKKLKELRNASIAFEKVEKSFAAVKQLADTANGKLDFETYAQMTYFERVLRAANLRLKIMSQNRYTLLRCEEVGDRRSKMGLGIEVLDSYTGKSRSANSLSGGESFMASLSLALGLSDVVQQSVGGIHLDAMFIDEGFGSLDADTLELAVGTLSEMAGIGRSVGIISHVAELRERIDKQIRVEKTMRGSKVTVMV